MTFAPIENQNVPVASNNSLLPDTWRSKLPAAPPRKRPTIWDGDHISETLAGIGAGFFSGQNFGDGLAAASQSMAGHQRQLREEQRPDISYEGPGGQFEVTTDRRTGARTIREVPEFRAAAERAAAAKRAEQSAPDYKTIQDRRSRALYTIASQVSPEQRAAAYQLLMSNPEQFGVDTHGMPAEWDDTYGAIAGQMGLSVNEGLTQERGNASLAETNRHNTVQEARTAAGQADVIRHRRVQETIASQRLRTPPASARKPKISSANSDLSYLLN